MLRLLTCSLLLILSLTLQAKNWVSVLADDSLVTFQLPTDFVEPESKYPVLKVAQEGELTYNFFELDYETTLPIRSLDDLHEEYELFADGYLANWEEVEVEYSRATTIGEVQVWELRFSTLFEGNIACVECRIARWPTRVKVWQSIGKWPCDDAAGKYFKSIQFEPGAKAVVHPWENGSTGRMLIGIVVIGLLLAGVWFFLRNRKKNAAS